MYAKSIPYRLAKRRSMSMQLAEGSAQLRAGSAKRAHGSEWKNPSLLQFSGSDICYVALVSVLIKFNISGSGGKSLPEIQSNNTLSSWASNASSCGQPPSASVAAWLAKNASNSTSSSFIPRRALQRSFFTLSCPVRCTKHPHAGATSSWFQRLLWLGSGPWDRSKYSS